VIDALLAQLADRARFPNLSQVVVTGHSGGGQFTQRYVSFGQAEELLPYAHVRYVVSNPSTYMYLTPDRYMDGQGFVHEGAPFAVCLDYDDYKYGLKDREQVLGKRALADDEVRRRYLARDVVYLLGEADTCNSKLTPSCDDSSLSTNCRAMIQGRFRLERGERFLRFLDTFYPRAHHHRLVTVPGVGHDGRKMYQSAVGVGALFGTLDSASRGRGGQGPSAVPSSRES
jgi:hypothetical protein